MPGDYLDLTNEPAGPSSDTEDSAASRKFLGINFACCGVYSRVYANREQTAYVGHCPKCSRRVQIKIGPGGSDTRFFTAY